VRSIVVNLTCLDDEPSNATSISLTKMSIPASSLLIDDEKWNRFFRPDEYQNRWLFFCRFEMQGNSTSQHYVDGYYKISIVVATENSSATVDLTLWLDISRDMTPTVSLTTLIDTVDWNTTSTLLLTGTAWDDKEVVSVEIRIDDGQWSAVNGTTEWSYALDVRAIPEGFHTVYLRSTDGLSESPKVSWSMSIVRPDDEGDGADGGGRCIGPLVLATVLIVILATVVLVALKRRRGGQGDG
jgi:hypothetical protein